jgi:carbon-monoxide dehydrogenase small subunit
MRDVVKSILTLHVNGRDYELPVGDDLHDVSPSETLAHTLRDRLGLTGAKLGCGQGACGCCTVIMDGKAIPSCMTLTLDCEDSDITTIEGLADEKTGELNALQQAFVDMCGFQCGYCTSGIIMTAQALLNENPHPSEEEVREALAGNYCRCGTHYTAVEAIMHCVGQNHKEAVYA